jgi:hypothetical protein
MCCTIHPFRLGSGEVLTEPGKLTVIAASMFLVVSSSMVNAAEPLTLESQDRKSFKTIPFDPAPSETQRRELDRVVERCIKTVEREVPGGHFTAYVMGAPSAPPVEIGRDLSFGSVCRRTDTRSLQSTNEALRSDSLR